MTRFKQKSRLSIGASEFVENQLNFDGVNYELAPIVRMTAPSEWKSKSLRHAPERQSLFNSCILLFGIILVDLHKIKFSQVLENGFKETSSSVLMKHWNHTRKVEQCGNGCEVMDDVSFSTRIPFVAGLVKPIYGFIFKHRHKRLKKKFGSGN